MSSHKDIKIKAFDLPDGRTVYAIGFLGDRQGACSTRDMLRTVAESGYTTAMDALGSDILDDDTLAIINLELAGNVLVLGLSNGGEEDRTSYYLQRTYDMLQNTWTWSQLATIEDDPEWTRETLVLVVRTN